MRIRVGLTVGLMVALSGCLSKKIPGTEIEDTSETRAVLDVVSKYRLAFEKRDAQAIIDLTDETFRDDGGSANPEDDLDYKTLFTALPGRFQRIQDVKLDVTVRRVEFDDDRNAARVTYSYQLSFRMPEYTSRTQGDTDIKQMTLKRVGEKDWKITSGI